MKKEYSVFIKNKRYKKELAELKKECCHRETLGLFMLQDLAAIIRADKKSEIKKILKKYK